MHTQLNDASPHAARIKRNTLRLGYWTLAWVLSMAVAAFGPRLIWDFHPLLSITAIFINLGIGVGMILANKLHLQGLDELQQKIQLEAMALSLGVGLVGGLGYSLLDITQLISSDAEISHIVILMSLTYMGGVVAGNRRYK